MLAAEKPDAVCILVPPEQLCRLTSQCLEMRIPVLVEKPPGKTLAEIDQMIKVADETQTPNQVAFNRRYTPLVQKMKSLLESDSAGLQHIRYDFCRIGRRDADFSTTAIHGIDTVRFLAGSDYARVHFYYQEMPELGPAVANIFLECTFESGATAQLNFTPVSGAVLERATLHAEDKVYNLHLPVWGGFDAPGRLFLVSDNQVQMDISGPQLSDEEDDYLLNGFYGENAAFFDDVRQGRFPQGDLKSGRQSVEIAQAMRERQAVYQKR
jgi:predicted dehydrogenase